MFKKLVAIVALASVLALGGCVQGQASPSASDSSGSAASVTAAGQSVKTSSMAAGQQGAISAEASCGSAAASAETEGSSQAAVSSTERADSFVISVGEKRFAVALAGTDAANALVEKLQAGPVTVSLHEYGGFEKVGPLPWSLPTSDEQITTQPGDVMLYQGNQITVFTGSNSWAYTSLGRIEEEASESLLAALGDGDVEIALSLR